MMNKIIMASATTMLFAFLFWGSKRPPRRPAKYVSPEQRIRDLEDRVIALEGKLRTIQKRRPHRSNRRLQQTQ
jgi:hypothetical protein